VKASPRDLVAALRERGLVHQVTDEALGPLSAKEPITAYIGFDPTADALHAGSLYPVMLLLHAALAGHRPIAVVGGGTGLIGDPSGRDSERPLMDPEHLKANFESLSVQITGLFSSAGLPGACTVIDNAAWLGGLNLIEFLRDTGKHFTVNWMMAKDSVRARLEDREQGISYTEFSYMLLQAHDFHHLWKSPEFRCRLQMGASDQWGNITAGVELIRKKEGGTAYGLTCPLLLTEDGRKFGKSAGNAVWLERGFTDDFTFYQFWMNLGDPVASHLLAAYTLLPMAEVGEIRAAASRHPESRPCQRRLAYEVTRLVRGDDAAERQEAIAHAFFGEGSVRTLDAATLEEAAQGLPVVDLPRSRMLGAPVFQIAKDALTSPRMLPALSGGEVRRAFEQGGISISGRAIRRGTRPDSPEAIAESDLLHGRYLVIRHGRRYCMVRATGG